MRVMVVFGTRPEAIKLAPVVLALKAEANMEPLVVVTAQHRSMLDQVLNFFQITPDRDLDILRKMQSLGEVTTRALSGLESALEDLEPDVVMVQGDTTTTFVGALAAFYHRLPVAHVEAGLRTGDPWSPYPEEINRRLTTQLTSVHLAPTTRAKDNLLAEGVDPSRVVITGNTVIDALLWSAGRPSDYGDPLLADLDETDRPVLLVTAHRRESWGEPMREVGGALRDIASAVPDLIIVFPIHRNPVVRDAIMPAVAESPNVRIIEPLAYPSFAKLMARCSVILTDSGGIQEEGPSLGKPVLVMRDTTERPEAVAAGTVRLVGTNRSVITESVLALLRDKQAYARMANAINPYGDGRAASRTVAALRHFYNSGPPVEPFAEG